jgi:hypothetical protein
MISALTKSGIFDKGGKNAMKKTDIMDLIAADNGKLEVNPFAIFTAGRLRQSEQRLTSLRLNLTLLTAWGAFVDR